MPGSGCSACQLRKSKNAASPTRHDFLGWKTRVFGACLVDRECLEKSGSARPRAARHVGWDLVEIDGRGQNAA